jgi:hypothetical protein
MASEIERIVRYNQLRARDESEPTWILVRRWRRRTYAAWALIFFMVVYWLLGRVS